VYEIHHPPMLCEAAENPPTGRDFVKTPGIPPTEETALRLSVFAARVFWMDRFVA
jgi:hypothetical protein